MKYLSVAVLALISTNQAIKLVDEDLFSDDYQAEESLASIHQAEQVHNAKFTGISAEDQRSLISAKTIMSFAQDEDFTHQKLKTFTYLGLDSQM